MPTDICGAVMHFGDALLTCHLPADHITPTEEQPQGSPHEDSGHPDVISADPWRWWG